MLNKVRMILKILLCIGVIITTSLVTIYLFNLQPPPGVDGIAMGGPIAQLFYGDTGWTMKMLANGCNWSIRCLSLLFIINLIFDIIALKKPKVKPE